MSLTLMSVGDIYIERTGPMSIFGNTVEYLRRADFLFGNLEGPISERGEPIAGKADLGSRWLRAPLRCADVLGELGFSAVTLANNHAMDFGAVALADTIDACQRAGVATFGGGSDLVEATKPAIVSNGGTSIASLGYTTVFPVTGYTAKPRGFAITEVSAPGNPRVGLR